MKKTNPIPEHAKMVFKGKIFEVWQWEQKLFDGTTTIFERLKRPDTALVIATVGDEILLQEEEQPDTRAYVSLPGGRCEEGEHPLNSAKRELLEETGYASEDWSPFLEESPASKIQWTIHIFVARDCKKVQEVSLDAGEKIQTRLISFDEFIALADNPIFFERELKPILKQAQYDQKKREDLRALLFKR